MNVYTVQAGDTLESIAKLFLVSVTDLQKWNNGKFPSLYSTTLPLTPGWVINVAPPSRSAYNVTDFGAIGHDITRNDGSVIAGSTSFVSKDGTFKSGDVGTNITVDYAATNTTLSDMLIQGASYSLLTVNPLTAEIASGANVVVQFGSNTQTFIAAATAPVGAIYVTVTAQVANYSYPIGSYVDPANLTTTITSVSSPTLITLGADATITAYGLSYTYTPDDTAAIQAAINAAGDAGGGTVFLPRGIYIVDLFTTTDGVTYALYQPSNVEIYGNGTIQLKADTSRPPTTNVLTIIYSSGESGLKLSATIDCNRLNQGPYTYGPVSVATGANSFLPRTVYYLECSDVTVQYLRQMNCAGQGLFFEGGCDRVNVGFVDSTDSLCAVVFDSATQSNLAVLNAANYDPALTISTTSDTTITAGASQTVTPASMTGIAIGTVLGIGRFTSVYERVIVTATTATTFTAYFANAHSGTYSIESAIFPSDSALQYGPGVRNASFGVVNVDYSQALAVYGSGVEIAGCKNVAGASVLVEGAWRSLWIHNWTIGSTLNQVEDVSIAAVAVVNSVESATGNSPSGVFIDDQGYTSANPVRSVNVSGAVVRYGQGGVALPNGYVAYQVGTEVVASSVSGTSDDGTNTSVFNYASSSNTDEVWLSTNITPASSTATTVVSLALPSGTYIVTGQATIHDTAAETAAVWVGLNTSATMSSVLTSSETNVGNLAGASIEACVSMSSIVTLPNGGTIYMVTYNSSGHPVIQAAGASIGGQHATGIVAVPL